MTTPTNKSLQREFANLSDSELRVTFDAIGNDPSHRVKSTGYVKLRWAKYGDHILAELKRRNG